MNKRSIISIILGAILAVVVSIATSTEPESTAINHQIVISGFQFEPNELKVSVGDTVTWVNKDIVPHNIAIDTKQKALSPDLQSGDTFVYKVNKSLTYICGFHPSMKGKLILSQ
jgi:plastocyanin